MFKGITHVCRAYTKGSSTYNYQAPQANWQKRIYRKNSSSQINLIRTTYRIQISKFQHFSISKCTTCNNAGSRSKLLYHCIYQNCLAKLLNAPQPPLAYPIEPQKDKTPCSKALKFFIYVTYQAMSTVQPRKLIFEFQDS